MTSLAGPAPPPRFLAHGEATLPRISQRHLGGIELAWIRRDGSFSLRQAEDDMLLTMQGSLRGGAGSGSFRIIETHPDGRGVCDTGPAAFTAGRSP
jgi:hypothetical protein